MKIGIAVGVLVLVIGSYWFIGRRGDTGDAVEKKSTVSATTVALADVGFEVLSEWVPFHGVTRGADRTTLAFEIQGQMLARPVEVGDKVSKNQVLATLDPEEYQLVLAEAKAQTVALKAQLEQARRHETRAKALLDDEAATEEEWEQRVAHRENLEASLEALHTRVKNLNRRLGKAKLKAPFAGVVTEIFKEPGEFVGPGVRLLSLSSAAQVEVEIRVPEAFMGSLAVGDALEVTFPFAGMSNRQATISSLGRFGPGKNALFPLILSFDDGTDLVPGLSVTVQLPKITAGAVQVPLAAVINPGGQQATVFVARTGVAEALDIDVVGIQGDLALVIGPFEADDRVVVGGHHRLLSGDVIREGE